jgi:hypothetical protein
VALNEVNRNSLSFAAIFETGDIQLLYVAIEDTFFWCYAPAPQPQITNPALQRPHPWLMTTSLGFRISLVVVEGGATRKHLRLAEGSLGHSSFTTIKHHQPSSNIII